MQITLFHDLDLFTRDLKFKPLRMKNELSKFWVIYISNFYLYANP